jgi:hypothetical protein
VTYDLELWNPAQNQNMIVQVLSVDGVGISPTSGASQQSLAQVLGNKASPRPCPGAAPASGGSYRVQPLCTTRLLMMPSTRVEIWVAYRNANGFLAAPPPGAQAIFRTAGFATGPDADKWPPIDLGVMRFKNRDVISGAPAALTVQSGVPDLTEPRALAADMTGANTAVASVSSCKPLAKHHKRRIFFGSPADDPNGSGLAMKNSTGMMSRSPAVSWM